MITYIKIDYLFLKHYYDAMMEFKFSDFQFYTV